VKKWKIENGKWKTLRGAVAVAYMLVEMRMTLRSGSGLFFAMVLFVCGCVRTVSKDELDDWRMEHAAASVPDRTYYVGSEGQYDYFVLRRGTGDRMHRYRVPKEEAAVRERFGRTTNEMEWREYGSEMVVTNGGPINR
jgi:hypothetical protein